MLDAAGTFIANLLTKGKVNHNVGIMGDFDTEQFVNSTLSSAVNTKGTDLPKVTRGIVDLLGFGPKKKADGIQRDPGLDNLGGFIDTLRGPQ